MTSEIVQPDDMPIVMPELELSVLPIKRANRQSLASLLATAHAEGTDISSETSMTLGRLHAKLGCYAGIGAIAEASQGHVTSTGTLAMMAITAGTLALAFFEGGRKAAQEESLGFSITPDQLPHWHSTGNDY
jgi:hypothetical protein